MLYISGLKGVDPDSSDDEWECSIRADYGESGAGMLREAAPQIDAGLDTYGLVNHAFHQYEILNDTAGADHEPPEGGRAPNEGVEIEDDEDFFIDADLEFPNLPEEERLGPDTSSHIDQGALPHAARAMLDDTAHTLLFAGARLSSLTATLILLNLCRTHGCSNAFVAELLTILSMSILPEVNTLPKTEYQASKILQKLGLSYEIIAVCPNNCMLFRGSVQEDLIACTVCHAPRFKRVGDSQVARKVLRYFPLIPKLQRIFSTPAQALLQTWWAQNLSDNGYLRCAADSPQRKSADTIDPDFAREHRNIRLGLATDGLNPFSI